jgi:hypothetical protein
LPIGFAPGVTFHVSHRLPDDSRLFLEESRRGGSPGYLGDFFSTHAQEIKGKESKSRGEHE